MGRTAKIENSEFLNPFDEGVTYLDFLNAIPEGKTIREFCEGKLTNQEIDFVISELEIIETIEKLTTKIEE